MSQGNHTPGANQDDGEPVGPARVLLRTAEEVLGYLQAAGDASDATRVTARARDDQDPGLIAEVAGAVIAWTERGDAEDLDGLDAHLRLRVGGRSMVHLLPGQDVRYVLILDSPAAVPVVVLGTAPSNLREAARG